MLLRILVIICVTIHCTTATDLLKEVFSWKQIDFAYPTSDARQFAIDSGSFVPEKTSPIGVAVSGSRLFITLPRWNSGVPATLTTINYYPDNYVSSPLLTPYPDWSYNRLGNCEGITSVYRVKVDSQCGRLWVLDTGVVENKQVCPAQVVTFDLNSDEEIYRYRFPQDVLMPGAMPASIEVEYPNFSCGSPSDAVLYVADVNMFTLIVSDLSQGRSWAVRHRTMYPTPKAGTLQINQDNLELMDGILGIALNRDANRLIYYPLSGYHQHSVETYILRNETLAQSSPDAYETYEFATRVSQAGSCGIDDNGVIFFGLLNRNALGCWNSGDIKSTIGNVKHDDETMQFLATTTVDSDGRLWTFSTRTHKFFLGNLNPEEVNYRIFMAPSTTELVSGTPCSTVGK